MKINLLATCLALCLSTLNSQALATVKTFDLTSEIRSAQNEFGSLMKYPILIFGQDEIDELFLKNQAYGDSKEKKQKRLEVIQSYVKSKINLNITLQEADQYEPFLTVLKGSAVALPLLNRGDRNNYYKMCAVFHASPNSNERLEIERILGLRTPGVYDNQAYESIKAKLAYEVLAKFSLYHEIGHCLDQTFLPTTYQYGGEDAHAVHESESFAELMGLFLLTQKGYSNIARTRGLLRTIYSRKMGRYFAQNPSNGFGNPFFVAGGVIYYLDPVLRAGDEVIRSSRGGFSKYTLEELRTHARDIVKANALNSRSFHAILRFHSEKNADDALRQYREYSYSSPDLFFNAYSDLIIYSDYTGYALSRILDNDAVEVDGGEFLSPVEMRELCTLVVTGQASELRERLDDYRQELQLGKGSPTEQRQRAARLNEIFEKELSLCQSVSQ